MTPVQTRIHRDLLELVSAGAAEIYLAACNIRNAEPKPPAATIAIGHFLREVDGAVRAALTPYEAAVPDKTNDEGHAAKISVVQAVLGVDDDDEHIVLWKRFATKNDPNHLIKYAHRRALSGIRPFDNAFDTLCSDFDTVFTFILDRLRANAAKITDKLRNIVANRAPTSADLQALRQNVPTVPFVFDRLLSETLPPAWIDGLLRDGFFTAPPPGAATSAAMMAARLAKFDLARARAIVGTLPDIDNTFAANAVIEVLLVCDSVDQTTFEKVNRWIRSRALSHGASYIYPQFIKLLVHLSKQNNHDEAFQLLDGLTALFPPNSAAQPFFRDAVAIFDGSEYDEILGAAMSTLLASDAFKLVELMTDRLERLLELAFDPPITTPDGLEDISPSWLPTFADSNIHLYSIKGALLKRFAEAVAFIAENSPDQVLPLMSFLRGRPYRAFRRLEAHLILKAGLVPQALVYEKLGDACNYWSIAPLPEFAELLRLAFPAASPAMQDIILSRIMNEFDRTLILGMEPNSMDRKREELRVQNYLVLLEGQLPTLHASLLEQLNAKLGRLPTSSVAETPPTVGSRLPWTKEELCGWTPDELAQKLAATPYTYDIGNLLREAVAEDPVRYELVLRSFDSLGPSYAYRLVSGFAHALAIGKTLNWAAILSFCLRVLKRPDAREQIDKESRGRWSALRLETCKLISSGSGKVSAQFGQDVYSTILAILDGILTDEPQSENEPTDLHTQLSYCFDDARANGLRALLRALNRFGADQNKIAIGERTGVRANPEAAELLLRFFAQPDIAIHTQAGSDFDFLCRLDHAFARTVVPLIFPINDNPDLAHCSAWQAFVTQAPVTFYTFDLLSLQYALALRTWPVEDTWKGNPDFNYADALATQAVRLFVHGRLSIDADLVPFYARLGKKAAARAIFRIAEAMADASSGISKPEMARFQIFWKWRREQITAAPADHVDELKAFGSIFCAAQLPEAVALNELQAVLHLSGGVIEPSHRILPCLREISDVGLVAALRCVILLVEGDFALSSLHFSADDIRTMLLRAKAIGGEAEKLAHEIASRLTAKRLVGFDTLL